MVLGWTYEFRDPDTGEPIYWSTGNDSLDVMCELVARGLAKDLDEGVICLRFLMRADALSEFLTRCPALPYQKSLAYGLAERFTESNAEFLVLVFDRS